MVNLISPPPVLTIAIPTYNRSNYLEEFLDLLINQINESNCAKKIEILVCDNCSTDNTKQVSKKYSEIIRYLRNDVNIGADANFLKLISEASGRYIWIAGDDDALRKDTMNFIIRMIDLYSFDYLYLRTQGLIDNASYKRGAIEMNNIELLSRVNIYTTFITSQVIRASLIKSKLEEARSHLGGDMAYYWAFLEALHTSRLCMVSEEKEIFPNSTENTGGYKFYRVWAESLFDILTASSFGKNNKVLRIMKFRVFFLLLLPITYRLRFNDTSFDFHPEDPGESIEKYFGSGFYKIIIKSYLKLSHTVIKPINYFLFIFFRFKILFQNNIL